MISEQPRSKTPAGLILCGGKSRRMGQPKAWLGFLGEPLLTRLVRLIGEVTDRIVVVAASGQELPDLPAGVQVVRDLVEDQGPLQGIVTGLSALPESVDLVYASATDVPFFQPAWVERLVELIGDHDLIVPEVGGFLHPLAALYRRGPVLQAAESLLRAGRRRPSALLDHLRGRIVGPELLAVADPAFLTLRNLNTPGEYEKAVQDAGIGGGGEHRPPASLDSSRLFRAGPAS